MMSSELTLGAKVDGNRNTLDGAKNKRSGARSLAAVTSDAINALRRAGQLLRSLNCTICPLFTARLTQASAPLFTAASRAGVGVFRDGDNQ